MASFLSTVRRSIGGFAETPVSQLDLRYYSLNSPELHAQEMQISARHARRPHFNILPVYASDLVKANRTMAIQNGRLPGRSFVSDQVNVYGIEQAPRWPPDPNLGAVSVIRGGQTAADREGLYFDSFGQEESHADLCHRISPLWAMSATPYFLTRIKLLVWRRRTIRSPTESSVFNDYPISAELQSDDRPSPRSILATGPAPRIWWPLLGCGSAIAGERRSC